MAHVLLRVSFADSNPDVATYGISQLAEQVADDLELDCSDYEVDIVSVNGPDEPSECMDCGCAPHFTEDRDGRVWQPCPTCDHQRCRERRRG